MGIRMRYKNLGGTGLDVSTVSLGTMTLGGRSFWAAIGTLDQSVADTVVARGLDAGVNFIDMADVCAEGPSEKTAGRAIRNSGHFRIRVRGAGARTLGPESGTAIPLLKMGPGGSNGTDGSTPIPASKPIRHLSVRLAFHCSATSRRLAE